MEQKTQTLNEKIKDLENFDVSKKSDFWIQKIEMTDRFAQLKDQIAQKDILITQKSFELESLMDQLAQKNEQIQKAEKNDCLAQIQIEKLNK